MAVRARDLDDDSALVVAVQAGDVAAFDELFRRHHSSVRRVCVRRLGDAAEADEIAQAAFVKAFERIDRCEGERRFGAWVQVIAHRLCIDSIRSRTRTRPDAEPVNGEAALERIVSGLFGDELPEEAVLRRERADKIHHALSMLPARQREVVVARDMEGRNPPEIAAALGLSVGAVDSLLLRARRRLAVSYQGALAESGVAGLPATVAGTVITSGAASIVEPSRFGRLRNVLQGLMGRMSSLVGIAPGGGPGPIRTAGLALAAAAVAAAPIVVTSDEPAPPPPAAVVVPAAAVPPLTSPSLDLPGAPPAGPPTAVTAPDVPVVPPTPTAPLPPSVAPVAPAVPDAGPVPTPVAPGVDLPALSGRPGDIAGVTVPTLPAVGDVLNGTTDAVAGLTGGLPTLPVP